MFERKSSNAGLVLGIIGTAIASITAVSTAYILYKMKKHQDEVLEERLNLEIDAEIEKALEDLDNEEQ